MASAEPELATLAARSELADLINDACGGLSDRDRTVLELAYHQELSGPELADALGVTHKNANNLVERLRDTIARSLGALLVCRGAKADPTRCPELAALLDDWDGRFTVLMRKRTARHIDGCPICEDERARMVTPAALLGSTPIVIPAPAWLRDRTLSQSPLGGPAAGSNESWWPQSDFDVSDVVGSDPTANAGDEPIPNTRGRVRAGVGVGLVLIGIAVRSQPVDAADAGWSLPTHPACPRRLPRCRRQPRHHGCRAPSHRVCRPSRRRQPARPNSPLRQPRRHPMSQPRSRGPSRRPPATSPRPAGSSRHRSNRGRNKMSPNPNRSSSHPTTAPRRRRPSRPSPQCPRASRMCRRRCSRPMSARRKTRATRGRPSSLDRRRYFFGSSTSVPTKGTRASGTRTLPSGC
jgi:hypothetical protein